MGALDGKIAVVTGGGTGIGYGIAERFIAEGAEVTIVGRRQARLDEAVEKLGPRARAVSADMGAEERVKSLFDRFERIDHLVTCAGGAYFGTIDEAPLSAWRELFAGRFFGQLYSCHFAVPKMVAGSSIILCSGIADRAYVPHYAGGSALCGAVNAMGRNLAVELAPRKIRVNVISPGLIGDTAIESNVTGDELIGLLGGLIESTPLGEAGTIEHTADAAMFFATCGYVTGQVVEVDGGWTAT